MSPRSNKQAKKSCVPRPYDEIKSDNTPKTTILTPETLGRKGFLALPPELICMILSYYVEIRTEDILTRPRYLPGHFLDRFKALRSLSQLCQLARKAYLPLLYERLQICIATKPAWYMELGNSLIKKCDGLVGSQHLWPYVRKITVCFSRFDVNRVLPSFIRLLKTLPNIETLEIPYAHKFITSIFKSYFQGNVFSTIQKVIMPTCAHEILRCCPGIREVTCNAGDGGSLVSAVISAGCSNLEAMNKITPGPLHMKRLIKANPPLKRVRFWTNNSESLIQRFSEFPTLRIIEIASFSCDADYMVKAASDTLRACAENSGGSSKGRRSRKGAVAIQQSYLNPSDSKVASEERLVRLLRYDQPGLPGFEPEKWSAAEAARFVPAEIKEFAVSLAS